MAWRETTVMLEKEAFVKAAMDPSANISKLCREFGISRKTGYKLLNRYRSDSKLGLHDKKRRPINSPKKTSQEMEMLVLKTRDSHKCWGGYKIRQYLLNQGKKDLPSEKTMNRILKRYGRICTEESEKHKPFIRFEHEHPNDLWQMDFKGHFELSGGGRCYPLTLLDDHSRFSLKIESCANERRETVKPALIALFRRYGVPLKMTMDNGAPWGYSGDQLHTKLTAWLIQLGIKVYHSRPGHPQTQGKLERFHRTLKSELLREYSFSTLEEAQRGFDWFRAMYNNERPHYALDGKVPADRYIESTREFPEIIKPYEYDSDFPKIRKVQARGEIYMDGCVYRIGKAFHGHKVALKYAEKKGLMDVYFCHQKVLTIDLNNTMSKS